MCLRSWQLTVRRPEVVSLAPSQKQGAQNQKPYPVQYQHHRFTRAAASYEGIRWRELL